METAHIILLRRNVKFITQVKSILKLMNTELIFIIIIGFFRFTYKKKYLVHIFSNNYCERINVTSVIKKLKEHENLFYLIYILNIKDDYNI